MKAALGRMIAFALRRMRFWFAVCALAPTAALAQASSSSPTAVQGLQFSDAPDFKVAGVTDWTAVGGHGSDAILQTSEALAVETSGLTRALKSGPAALAEAGQTESRLRADVNREPTSFAASHALGAFYLHAGRYAEAVAPLEHAFVLDPKQFENEWDLALACEGADEPIEARDHVLALRARSDTADLHRLEGQIDESLADPVAAERELERAARMSPSEENYFAWGSELLLHRAVWQSVEVFEKGLASYPDSTRLETALGAALFAGARYQEAARHLCAASDRDPQDAQPYLFLGRMQIAAPDALTCVAPRLARFTSREPRNALAFYYYAMAMLKQSPGAVQQAQKLLSKAVELDSRCGDAYVELGMLADAKRDFDQAVDFYKQAIIAKPELEDAYYRLGIAYTRAGDTANAKQMLDRYIEVKKQHAEEVESERRKVKQFRVEQIALPAQ